MLPVCQMTAKAVKLGLHAAIQSAQLNWALFILYNVMQLVPTWHCFSSTCVNFAPLPGRQVRILYEVMRVQTLLGRKQWRGGSSNWLYPREKKMSTRKIINH